MVPSLLPQPRTPCPPTITTAPPTAASSKSATRWPTRFRPGANSAAWPACRSMARSGKAKVEKLMSASGVVHAGSLGSGYERPCDTGPCGGGGCGGGGCVLTAANVAASRRRQAGRTRCTSAALAAAKTQLGFAGQLQRVAGLEHLAVGHDATASDVDVDQASGRDLQLRRAPARRTVRRTPARPGECGRIPAPRRATQSGTDGRASRPRRSAFPRTRRGCRRRPAGSRSAGSARAAGATR